MFFDPFKNKKYGDKGERNDDEVLKSLHPNDYEPDKVPQDKVKKYLSVEAQPVGVVNKHFGLANDSIPKNIIFGRKNDSSISAKELINPPEESEFQKKIKQQNEEVYQSSKIPIGKTVVRGYHFPNQTNDPNFKFGIKTVYGDPATLIVCPPEGPSFQEFHFLSSYFEILCNFPRLNNCRFCHILIE